MKSVIWAQFLAALSYISILHSNTKVPQERPHIINTDALVAVHLTKKKQWNMLFNNTNICQTTTPITSSQWISMYCSVTKVTPGLYPVHLNHNQLRQVRSQISYTWNQTRDYFNQHRQCSLFNDIRLMKYKMENYYCYRPPIKYDYIIFL